MAMPTVCQTSGAQFHTCITSKTLSVSVDFGKTLNLNEEESILLEANVHNALELVLARYYVQSSIQADH
jgi:hypothetical protein